MLAQSDQNQNMAAASVFQQNSADWQKAGIIKEVALPKAETLTVGIVEQSADISKLLASDRSAQFGFTVEGSDQVVQVSRQTLEKMQRKIAINATLGELPEIPRMVVVGSLDDNAYMALAHNMVLVCLGAFTAEPDNSVACLLNKVGHEVGHKVDQHHKGSIEQYKEEVRYLRESRADSLNCLLSGDYAGAVQCFAKAAETNLVDNDWDESVVYDENGHPCDMQRMKMAIRLFANDKTLSYEQRREQYKKLEAFNAEFFPKLQEAGFELKQNLLEYYHDEYAKAHPHQGKSGAIETPAQPTIHDWIQEAIAGMQGRIGAATAGTYFLTGAKPVQVSESVGVRA